MVYEAGYDMQDQQPIYTNYPYSAYILYMPCLIKPTYPNLPPSSFFFASSPPFISPFVFLTYLQGRVIDFFTEEGEHQSKGKHLVKYDDGEQRRHLLSDREFSMERHLTLNVQVRRRGI